MKKLKPQKIDWLQIERFLQSAKKKLASAHKILAFDEEACLQQAYEAMLKASLGFMFSHGFRARSQPSTTPPEDPHALRCFNSIVVSSRKKNLFFQDALARARDFRSAAHEKE